MLLRPSTPARALVRLGTHPTARQHNALVQLSEQATVQRGPVKGRHMPDGFTPKVTIQATLSVDYNFRVSVSDGDQADEMLVTFTPGDVAGIIPKIGDTDLTDVDEQGNAPALIVKADAWKQVGNVERALIMFRYELQHQTFAVIKVIPVAVPAPPAAAPWTWHKLIAMLIRPKDGGSVTVSQRVFFSQLFDVANAQPSGSFTPLPHLAS